MGGSGWQVCMRYVRCPRKTCFCQVQGFHIAVFNSSLSNVAVGNVHYVLVLALVPDVIRRW